MKKTLLFIAGSAILFAACNNEPKKDDAASQAQIDSAVNARVAQEQAAMQAKNDSIVAAEAKIKADSMALAEEKAHKGGKGTHKSSGTAKAAPASPVATPMPTPTTPGGLRSQSDQNKDNPNKASRGRLNSQADKH